MTTQPPRTTDIPCADSSQLRAICERRGVQIGTVLYTLFTRAAAAAHAYGHDAGLPQVRPSGRARRGSVGEVEQVRWRQGGDEYRDCVAAIEAAGSTVTATMRAGVSAYVEADGDVVRLAWPPFPADQAAA